MKFACNCSPPPDAPLLLRVRLFTILTKAHRTHCSKDRAVEKSKQRESQHTSASSGLWSSMRASSPFGRWRSNDANVSGSNSDGAATIKGDRRARASRQGNDDGENHTPRERSVDSGGADKTAHGRASGDGGSGRGRQKAKLSSWQSVKSMVGLRV